MPTLKLRLSILLMFTAAILPNIVTLFAQTQLENAERKKYFPKTREKVRHLPKKKNLWVFVMAGQSNMAGRGQVAAEDTLPNPRIVTINAQNEIVYAKEPLHFYEPSLTGLDCGLSFASELLKTVPKRVKICMLPTAIGGSAVDQWLGDSLYRSVRLLTNFKEKVAFAQQFGTVKAILWHQGESDAHPAKIPAYASKVRRLFSIFRETIQNNSLPILVGELGSFSQDNANWQALNKQIHSNGASDPYIKIIPTADLEQKGDKIHFNAAAQRTMGQRMARSYAQHF